MQNETTLDLRRTQLLAVEASLNDARNALVRASRIPSVFTAEVRTILAAVADISRRVLADAQNPE